MKKPIHTKYHKLFGANMLMSVGGRAMSKEQFNRVVNKELVAQTISALQHIPRYVIYEDLIEMMNQPDSAMQKSLNVLADNSLARLPFPSIMVEFDQPADITDIKNRTIQTKVRHFVWLAEGKINADQPFNCMCWTLVEEPHRNVVVLSPIAASANIISADKASSSNIEIIAGESGAGCTFQAVPSFLLNSEIMTKKEMASIVDKSLAHSMTPVTKALCALMVLIHTKGISQDKIEIEPKWNKSREKSGKPRIQDHTVIRIGHTYDKDGVKREYKHGSPYNYPVYWVPGHIRGVRYGPKRSKIYDLFIEPYLVNYKEGDIVPKPKTKEVTI